MVNTFGQWLRQRRKERGLTLEELGERIGRTKAYMSTLERGQSASKSGDPVQASVKDVEKIARALGVLPNEARLAAGYAPIGKIVDPMTEERLLEYYRSLPAAERKHLFAIAETFYREVMKEAEGQQEDAA